MSQYRKFSVSETLQAVMVEIIRRLWHSGKFRSNAIMQKIVDQHFDLWVDWRTQITMRDVDNQAAEIVADWEAENLDTVEQFLYNEIVKGETPLGGEMRVTATFMDREKDGDV